MPGIVSPWFVVLGYNAFILIAGTGYLFGATQGKEYAEPEWYADLWLTIVWVVYLLVFFGNTLETRRTTYLCRKLVLLSFYRYNCDASYCE